MIASTAYMLEEKEGIYPKTNTGGQSMTKYVLCVCDGIKQWTLMTRENYTAYIRNAREKWTFEGHNGFESTEDVLAYVEKYFKISRNDIEII